MIGRLFTLACQLILASGIHQGTARHAYHAVQGRRARGAPAFVALSHGRGRPDAGRQARGRYCRGRLSQRAPGSRCPRQFPAARCLRDLPKRATQSPMIWRGPAFSRAWPAEALGPGARFDLHETPRWPTRSPRRRRPATRPDRRAGAPFNQDDRAAGERPRERHGRLGTLARARGDDASDRLPTTQRRKFTTVLAGAPRAWPARPASPGRAGQPESRQNAAHALD